MSMLISDNIEFKKGIIVGGDESDSDDDYDNIELEYDEEEVEDIREEVGYSKHVELKDRKTINKLTDFERTNVIGTRARHLSLGAQPYLSEDEMIGLNTSIEIAKKELELRRIPMLIFRHIGDGDQVEIWSLSEMVY